MTRRATLLLLFFVMAAATDGLSVWWQEAREADNAAGVAGLSMLLETLTWLPVWFALRGNDWRIAAFSVAGSAAGAYLAMQ